MAAYVSVRDYECRETLCPHVVYLCASRTSGVPDVDRFTLATRWLHEADRPGWFFTKNGPKISGDHTYAFYMSDANTAFEFKMRWG